MKLKRNKKKIEKKNTQNCALFVVVVGAASGGETNLVSQTLYRTHTHTHKTHSPRTLTHTHSHGGKANMWGKSGARQTN